MIASKDQYQDPELFKKRLTSQLQQIRQKRKTQELLKVIDYPEKNHKDKNENTNSLNQQPQNSNYDSSGFLHPNRQQQYQQQNIGNFMNKIPNKKPLLIKSDNDFINQQNVNFYIDQCFNRPEVIRQFMKKCQTPNAASNARNNSQQKPRINQQFNDINGYTKEKDFQEMHLQTRNTINMMPIPYQKNDDQKLVNLNIGKQFGMKLQNTSAITEEDVVEICIEDLKFDSPEKNRGDFQEDQRSDQDDDGTLKNSRHRKTMSLQQSILGNLGRHTMKKLPIKGGIINDNRQLLDQFKRMGTINNFKLKYNITPNKQGDLTNKITSNSPNRQADFTQNQKFIGIQQEALIKKFEELIKDKIYYQDLFKLGFNLEQLDLSLKTLDKEEKMLLVYTILDLLFKTDKLKHAFPPLKMQQFKKQNARPYDFKEKEFLIAFGGDDDMSGAGGGGSAQSSIANKLRESQLLKKGIRISESVHKRKIKTKDFNQKSLDVIEQNKLNSRLK
eukprot:403370069